MPGAGPVPDAGNQADENLGGGTGKAVIGNLARQVTRAGRRKPPRPPSLCPASAGPFFFPKKAPPPASAAGPAASRRLSVSTYWNTKKGRPPSVPAQPCAKDGTTPTALRGSN